MSDHQGFPEDDLEAYRCPLCGDSKPSLKLLCASCEAGLAAEESLDCTTGEKVD